jgi:sucrose-phosphate synthase
MGSWCLVTDIDGTLIGEEQGKHALRARLLQEREQLARRGVRLYWAIATGRTLASTRRVLRDEGFDDGDFDALVTSVGAEIHLPGEPGPHEAYRARLAASGFERERVELALRALPGLELQAEQEQFAYKVSYFMDDLPHRRRRVADALSRLPFATQAVFSHGSYLDVTPGGGAKGGAVRHLLELWRLKPERVVAAGDSGNDLQMLDQDWLAIVVRNGHGALAELRGRRNVHFATATHAGGVLQGLLAHGLLSRTRAEHR